MKSPGGGTEAFRLVTEERTRALRAALARKGLRVSSAPEQTVAPIEEGAPLSFGQEQLWLIDRLEGGLSATYNMPAAMALDGNLDPARLGRSLTALVQRHAVFRTRIAASGSPSKPHQLVDPTPVHWPLPLIDLSDVPEPERASEACADAEARRPFRLETEWPLRTLLLRLAPTHHVLLVTFHHIAADGWSLGILVRDLTALYRADGDATRAALPLVTLQYVDYARWQRAWLQGPRLESLLTYWRGALRDAPARLTLPAESRSETGLPRRGAMLPVAVPAETVRELHALARQQGATLFMVALTAYAALLGRLAGQAEVCIGTPVANRRRAEWEELAGYFVNTLVIRCSLAGAPTWRELLSRVQTATQEAYAHQDLPFERLVQALAPPRTPGSSPLFQAMLAWQNTPMTPLALPDVTVTPLVRPSFSAKFDVTLSVHETEAGLAATIEYDAQRFPTRRVEHWARLFERFLISTAANPDRAVADEPLLSAEESDAVLRRLAGDRVGSRDAAAADDEPQTIGEQFAAIARTFPDTTAIISDAGRMTYRELDRRSNQLAHHLLRCGGAAPARLVGLALPRGPLLISALLGTLKAGCAYVYLDPTHPPARHHHILTESGANLILTLSTHAPLFTGNVRCIALDNNADVAAIRQCPGERPSVRVGPQQLAYVIYTSGSTGVPKGVGVEHRGVINLARWQQASFQIRPGDAITQCFSYNFDGSVGETMMALLNGGTLVIIDLDRSSPAQIVAALNDHDVRVAVFVPSILAELDPAAVTSRGLTIVSVGEACPPRQAHRWSQRCRFVNAYGPTEYTVYSHAWTYPSPSGAEDHRLRLDRVPIGRAMHNTHAYVLDASLRPVPEGVVGDLYLAGDGLARGYLSRPSATAAAFLPNPFWPLVDATNDGWLDEPEAAAAIRRFLAAHEAVRRARRPSPPASPLARIEEAVARIAPDTAEAAHDLLRVHRGDAAFVGGLCRYIEEGAADTYHAAGINAFVLRAFLPNTGLAGAQGADFGFGGGEILDTLRRMGARALGIDAVPFFVQAARDRGLPAALARVDGPEAELFARTGLAPHSLDFAISTLVLDRVAHPRQLLRNLFAVLRPGGCFALQTLLPLVPIDDGDTGAPIVYTADEHRVAPGRDAAEDRHALLRLLAALGATDIHLRRLRYVVASLDGVQTYDLWSFHGRYEPGALASPWLRMYRTGDRARWLADGSLEFLSREDRQIKRHGYRIELDEVEAAVRSHPDVHHALVLFDAHDREQRLIACWMSRPGAMLDAATMRGHVHTRLPPPMMPSRFLPLARWPLTSTGKIDTAALVRLANERTESAAPEQAPVDGFEAHVAAIWASELGLPRVGRHQGFFELGGHSLLALRVAARIERELGIALGMRDLFDRPTVATLATRLRMAPAAPEGAADRPLARADRRGRLPLSFAQQRIWFADRLEDSAALTLFEAWRWRGALNIPALTRALTLLVERHEILRTVYPEVDGVPWQQVCDPRPMSVPLIDLNGTDLSYASTDTLARRLLAHLRERRLSLEFGPVLRVVVVRLTPADHVVAALLHHIAVDGWSMDLLVRELGLLYDACDTGRAAPLPPVPIQYADYAAWQRGQVDRGALNGQRTYWRERLRNVLPEIDLAPDRPRQPDARRGDVLSATVSGEALARVRGACREAGVTPFMYLAAALDVLLARISGRDDVVIGLNTANRSQAAVAGTVGPFLNLLLLRTHLDGDPTFAELLARVRRAALEAFANQDLPFELVLDDLRPTRQAGRPALFNVLLNALDLPAPAFAPATHQVERFDQRVPVPNVDLAVYTRTAEHSLSIDWVFDAGMFERDTMTAWLRQYVHLLQAAADMLAARISTLPLLPDHEADALVARRPLRAPAAHWRSWPADWTDLSLTDLIDRRAEDAPDRLAVTDRHLRLTYGELRVASDLLAARLIAAGAGPGARIALVCGQRASTVVALLAALKTGAAYVPLDPRNPLARLRLQVLDAGPALLLADTSNASLARQLAGAAPGHGLPVVLLDPDAPVLAASDRLSAAAALPTVPPASLAYLLYTSGSTGTPKAVMQSQAHVLRHLDVYSRSLGIGPTDRLSLIPSYAFDAAVMDVYGALLNGASLHVFDLLEKGGGASIVQYVRDERVTIYHATPTVFRSLAAALGPGERLPDVRLVVLGGESALREDAEAFCEHFTDPCQLVNGLGPTESTLALQFMLDRDTAVTRRTIPVGYPVDDVEVRLVSRGGLEVRAMYEPGEIVIESHQVALGYWRDEELTRRAFSTEGVDRRREYHTGDLARRLPDGSLEFIGRQDSQIKIRGMRIEPAEVEAVLLRHPGVRHAVVVAHDGPGAAQPQALVAYIVPAISSSWSPAHLRAFLADQLPATMLPSAIVALDRLPLLPNGKLDRRALPPPTPSRPNGPGSALEGPFEAALAAIWRALLGLEQIHAMQDVFEAGAHSLLLPQFVAIVRTRLGVDLPLRWFFEEPTIAGLAARIESHVRNDQMLPEWQPVRPAGRSSALSVAQERVWYLSQLSPASLAYQHAIRVEVSGRRPTEYLVDAWRETIRAHPLTGFAFPAVYGRPAVVQCDQAAAHAAGSATIVDLTALAATDRSAVACQVAHEIAQQPLPLATGPLVRAAVCWLDARTAELVASAHDVVGGGALLWQFWRHAQASPSIIGRESFHTREYAAAASEPFAAAAWQAALLDSAHGHDMKEFWRASLADVSPSAKLPTRQPRTEGGDDTTSRHDGVAKMAIHRFTPAHDVPALAARWMLPSAHILLGALHLVLHHHTGSEHVTTGLPCVAGPQRLDAADAMPLRSLLLVSSRRDDAATADTWFATLLQEHAAGYAHRAYPIERLLSDWPNTRVRAQLPLLQALFVCDEPLCEKPGMSAGMLERATPDADRIETRLTDAPGELPPFDLTIHVSSEPADTPAITLSYNPVLFEPALIARLATDLDAILTALIGRPETTVGELLFALPPPLAPHADESPAALALDLGEDAASPATQRTVLEGALRALEGTRLPGSARHPSLVELQPEGAGTPFFCLHPISGSVSCFHLLAQRMGRQRQFYGIQAKGLDGIETPFDTIEEMAAHYVEAMRGVSPNGPFLIGGWSSGGLVAIEAAAQLQRAGDVVGLVCLLDTQAMSFYDPRKATESDDVTLLSEMLMNRVPLPEAHLRTLPLDQQLAFVLDRLKLLRLAPPGFGLPWFRGYFQAFRANRRAMWRYRARRFDGPLVLFRAQDDARELPADLGWAELASRLTIVAIPGDHGSMLLDPHVDALAATLNRHLDAVAPSSPKRDAVS